MIQNNYLIEILKHIGHDSFLQGHITPHLKFHFVYLDKHYLLELFERRNALILITNHQLFYSVFIELSKICTTLVSLLQIMQSGDVKVTTGKLKPRESLEVTVPFI